MRMMSILLLALAVAPALAQNTAVEEDEKVYKWIDADGVEHYGATLPADQSNIEVLDLDEAPVSTINGDLRPAEQRQLEAIEQEDRIEEQNQRTPQVVIIERAADGSNASSTGSAILTDDDPSNDGEVLSEIGDDDRSDVLTSDVTTPLPDASGDGVAGNADDGRPEASAPAAADGEQPDISAPAAADGEQPGISAPEAADGSQPGISAPGASTSASPGSASSGGGSSGGGAGGGAL